MGHRDAADAGFTNLEGFVFVSSPNATTPFHSDPEDNFFVQIHGDKFFHVIDNTDGSVVPPEAFEITPSMHRNLPYRDTFESRATVFSMKAGRWMLRPVSLAALGADRRELLDLHGHDLEVAGDPPLQQGAVHERPLRKWGFPQKPLGRARRSTGSRPRPTRLCARRSSRCGGARRLRNLLRGALFGRNANYYLASRKG
jgi:hypothetical protein